MTCFKSKLRELEEELRVEREIRQKVLEKVNLFELI
jgi:hypothetical protein